MDAKGRHVTGFKPEDFQILEDGKPQKITHFWYVPGIAIPGGPAPVNPAPRKPSGKMSEAIPAPVKALRPEEVRRTIVLMADDLGLSADVVDPSAPSQLDFTAGSVARRVTRSSPDDESSDIRPALPARSATAVAEIARLIDEETKASVPLVREGLRLCAAGAFD